MKVALALCLALLSVILVQAADEMAPPSLPAGSRVANGIPATPKQLPFMAYIEASDSANSTWHCAGSLITRSAVLTAALCVYNKTTFTVRLGSIYRTGDGTNSWTVDSIWALSHPQYDRTSHDYNIAIIYLPRLAPLNEFIQLVYLPCSAAVSSYFGRQGIVAGWGYTTPNSELSYVLRWAEVVVIPNGVCKNFTSRPVTGRQLCAGSYTTTVRNGDYGAPLVLATGEQYTQIGLYSTRVFFEFNTSHPVIYTRVATFINWIKLNTGYD